ncbi:MAG: electron transport complex subunit RsxC [Lentimicrobiaceae bacterium]|nr:electron transport complex subunit RsxC [Lentimicrobiaceae bacterium]MCP4909621.1 electron transport complex subunit RsxC [Bacteroidota bacterium]MBT3454788.1 electron transport complex subunit RsxC [Lentimicrobiaceae bacterium]MBT3819608.1 electron transport complex subunit RsxC [Lentimicrobiaceae bacterium]MBT4061314.1 electron transport complex subunit RsxC [Lentimicrobiaceae bacterium]
MLRTFALGGIHPDENKLSSNAAIEEIPVPKQAIVPLGQNLGAPSKPIVKKGDDVKVGQLIAEAGGFISTNIHSPVSGKVFKIDNSMDASGFRRPCIIINVDGDEWDESVDTTKDLISDINIESKEIIERIKNAGIVGMGGATFPTYVKLMPPPGKTAEYLIINGVECEPYLTSDHRMMLEKGREIVIGIKILMKALNVNKAFIGIENNKPDAISHMRELVRENDDIQVQPLKVQYPQGGEKQLIKASVNREVPSGKLPIEVGCVVQNVGTAFAVYEAVQKNKPLIERVVTVTGKAVKKPSNFRVRIGTPINVLIEAAEGLPDNTGKIINGGPMMGKSITSLDMPVVKGTSGILLLEKEESSRKVEGPCIRCSKCTYVCPMGLEPFLISKAAKLGNFELAENESIMDCIECGSCQYGCPAAIPLVDYLRLGKIKVGQIMRSRKN